MTKKADYVGVCLNGARYLAAKSAAEKKRYLESECGMKDARNCKVHAEGAYQRSWEVAKARVN